MTEKVFQQLVLRLLSQLLFNKVWWLLPKRITWKINQWLSQLVSTVMKQSVIS